MNIFYNLKSKQYQLARIFFVFFSLFLNFSNFASEDWELVNNESNVKVFKKEMPGSDIVAFRGETTIEAPMIKIFSVINDNDHRKEWVDRLLVNKILESYSDYSKVIYQEFSLPWPLSNRDFVYKSDSTKDEKGRILIQANSMDHIDSPETAGVRGRIINTFYRLTPINANSTFVEVEVFTDPMGLLPVWLVNLIQKSWPLKTLNGIKNMVNKKVVPDMQLPN